MEILVFGEDFSRHAHCLEHLMLAFPKSHSITWVETVGLRPPKLNRKDFIRAVQKIKGWFSNNHPHSSPEKKMPPENIHILRPMGIPWWVNPIPRFINGFFIRYKVLGHYRKRSKRPDFLISSIPSIGFLYKNFDEKYSIYYCVDDFSLWPDFPKVALETLERESFRNADLVLCTSRYLLKKALHLNPRSIYFTHGVDVSHFNIPAPTLMAPYIFCLYGIFDQRIDQELLIKLAKRIPYAQIHIWGKVVVDIEHLKHFSNIKFLGEVSYQDLPRYISSSHCFILPYLLNQQTESIFPLKIKEYLATGRPTIATALPDLRELNFGPQIGKTHDEFIDLCIKQSQTPTNLILEQKDWACTHDTWESRVELLIQRLKSLPKDP